MYNKKENPINLVVILGLIILLGFMFKLVLYPIYVTNKTVNTAYEVTDKVMDADNVVTNYEWFKTQYNAIEQQREKIEQAEEELNNYVEKLPKDIDKWTDFQNQEEASLRGSLSANKKVLLNLISEYNSKASMVTRSVFKGELPSKIEE